MRKIVTMLLAVVGISTSHANDEIAPYTVATKDAEFEVRDYPALVLVETAKTGDEGNGSFGRLFRYISGSNEAAQKIPMTAPVFMDARGSDGKMSFVMPSTMPLDKTPQAKDANVSVREQPAGRYAVYRFTGSINAEGERKALEKLTAWMNNSGLKAAGKAVYAYYDPPWTIPFFRRNEVMIALANK